MTKEYERHPLSAAYGDMVPEMFRKLQVSMSAGFDEAEPVLLFPDNGVDKVLDGWHRYLGAKGLVPVKFEKFKGTLAEAKALVKRKNYRRGLTVGQLISVELEVEAYQPEPGSGSPAPRTDKQVAEDLGVTERSVGQFRAVQRNAIPEVRDAVKSGDVSLKKAAQVAKLPADQQKGAIATPRDKSHEEPSTAKKWKPVKPEVGASKEALEEMKERNTILAEENDRLTLRVGLDAGAYSDEERAMLEAQFAEMKARIADLEHNLLAVTDSRDSYMNENRELKGQCAMYRNQLQKRAA